MKLGQAFKMAAKSIFSNIGRSALTMLGIIIGLAAVIILVSYAQGQNAAMRAYYESMGTNTVEVYAYTWDSSLDVSKSLYNYCLGLDNLVVGFTPSGQVYTDAKISYGSKTLPTDDYQTATTLYLGNDQYGLCNDYQIARGRELSFLDMEKLNQVCVLGSATAEELFSFADPLDKTITINGIPFRVVGVYESKSKGVKVGTKEEDQYLLDEIKRKDRMILIPYTMTRYFNNNQPIDQFVVKVKSSDAIAPTVTSLNGFLSGLIGGERQLRHLPPDLPEGAEPGRRHAAAVPGGHRRHLPAGGRHRHYEHHAGHRHRAHPGDRHPQGHRRRAQKHHCPIFD